MMIHPANELGARRSHRGDPSTGPAPIGPTCGMTDSRPLYCSFAPSVGVVIGTFAAVPYVHLQLESWRRNYPQTPLLVSDGASPVADELRKLCASYDAVFVSNPARLRQTVGDLSAYVIAHRRFRKAATQQPKATACKQLGLAGACGPVAELPTLPHSATS